MVVTRCVYYRLAYEELVGGVLNMRTEHFQRVNGYSNLYWGWGAEDDDMAYRYFSVHFLYLIHRLHYRPNIEQTVSKCIQNTRFNCSTSARRLLAFIQLARRAMVISMLIRRAGGL